MRKFQLAAEGVGEQQPPEHLREQLKAVMSPLPIWYSTQAKSEEDNEYPKGSANHRKVSKVVTATKIVQSNSPEIKIEGELQFHTF